MAKKSKGLEYYYSWVTDPSAINEIGIDNIPETLLDKIDNNDKIVSGKLVLSNKEILDLVTTEIIDKFSNYIVYGTKDVLQKGMERYRYKINYYDGIDIPYFAIKSWIDIISYYPLELSLDSTDIPDIFQGNISSQGNITSKGNISSQGNIKSKGNISSQERYKLEALATAGLNSIIESVISKRTGINIYDVEETIYVYEYEDLGEGYPYIKLYNFIDKNLQTIHASTEERMLIQYLLPLNVIYGWKYLSDSKLTLQALQSENINVPLRNINGVYIIPIYGEYDGIVDKIYLKIRSLINEGCFALDIGEYDEEKSLYEGSSTPNDDTQLASRRTLYYEVLERFGFEIISSGTPYEFDVNPNVQKIYPNNIFNDDNIKIFMDGQIVVKPDKEIINLMSVGGMETWIKNTVSRIMANKLPLVSIRGPWQLIGYVDTSDISSSNNVSVRGEGSDGKEETISRVTMLAYIAYRDLIEKYKYLESAIYYLRVEDDLSITIAVTSKSEMIFFSERMKKHYERSNLTQWNVFKVENMEDMVIKRWVLYNKFKVETFAVAMEKSTYIVCNSRIDKQRLAGFPWDIKNKDIIEELDNIFGHDEHERDLLFYLNYVPVVDIIQPYEDEYYQIQMVNRDQLLRSSDVSQYDRAFFVNPVTQNPIDNKSLARVITYPQGWMGFFDIGVVSLNKDKNNKLHNEVKNVFLPGILKSPPTKYLMDIDFGVVKINSYLSQQTFNTEFIMSVNVTENKKSYCLDDKLSNLSDIEKLDNYLTVNLFDISYYRIINENITSKDILTYDNLDELKTISENESNLMDDTQRVIQWIWSKGWFLSLWSIATIISSGSMSCSTLSYIYPLDAFIRSAGESPEDGEKTLEYLNLLSVLLTIN